MQILLTPFSWLINVFNSFFNNYGLALILFALLVKLILFPLSLKGKRSMIQMNAMSAKVNKLQKMYGNNKEKYNQEVQKLYEKEKVNPMGGCLWSMLPLFILLPLYAIVREPLTYMMSLTADQVTALLGVLGVAKEGNGFYQLVAADQLSRNFAAVLENPAVAAFADQLKALNFNFLGINLAQSPNWKFWADGVSWGSVGLFLLPIISALTSVLFSLFSMKTNAVNQQTSNDSANSTAKSMMYMSPLISLWIGFSMPASMSIYWISQNIFSLAQEFIAGKMLKKDYEKAAEDAKRREEEEKEEELHQREVERLERSKRIEESKNKKKAPKKETADDKIPGVVKENSRVGIRTYARGRAYDPNRFSADGATAYPEAAAGETEK